MNDQRVWFRKKLEEVQALSGYDIGETVESLARRLKRSPSEIVKLNANENFFIPKEKLDALFMEAIKEQDPRIYPQEEDVELRKALGKYLSVSPGRIVIENGSDQLIDLVARVFLEKGDEALSVTPTFSMYQKVANFQGARFIGVPLKEDFSLDVERILAMKTAKTKLFFLCSPNNPTANQFAMEEIQSLIEELKIPVVVDEAYVEFAKYSVVRLVEKLENLIVFRTFSKAFGLAGLRLGYAVSNVDAAKALSMVQLPYNVSSLALRIGLKLLENIGVMRRAVGKLKEERDRFVKELSAINGVTAFDSQTNFVLFQTRKQSVEAFQALLSQGVLVKNLGGVLHLSNCLRTTVGLPEMNGKLLDALEQLCGEGN